MSTPDPNPPNTQADGFAQSDEDAAKKAKQHGERDPLPDVDPALLNSSDVIEYIRLTGMVYPFDSSEKAQLDLFKTASYEVPLVGEMHWIDEDRNHQRVTLDPRSDSKSCRSFTLKKNQIAFFSPTVTFRLPLYIAMRFNLHISHVHKGLLLGTGPIVDPGFEGRLLIPLHNLTAHDYDLQAGQGVIWIEFTKISSNIRWADSKSKSKENRFVIKKNSNNLSAEDYFRKAWGRTRPAESSIPSEIREIKSAASTAKYVAWGAIGTVVLGILAMLISTWGLISDAGKNVADSNRTVLEARDSLNRLTDHYEKVISQQKALEIKLDAVKNDRNSKKNGEHQRSNRSDGKKP